MVIITTRMGQFIVILTLVTLGMFYFWENQSRQQAEILQTIQDNVTVTNAQANLLPIASPNLIEPVEGFRDRITKKPFGIYITPETSPVQLDRFTGYHTGVDIEFTDSSEDIPVLAIADGTILIRAYASGYGGVVVVRHVINGVPIV